MNLCKVNIHLVVTKCFTENFLLFIDLNLYGEALSLVSNYPEMFGSTQVNGFGY